MKNRALTVILTLLACVSIIGSVISMVAASHAPDSLPALAPASAPTLAPVIIRPLNSRLPNPTELNICVANAFVYTIMTYADAGTLPTVVLAKQVTDAELAKLAPSVAGHGPSFGVLMNLVIFRGSFHTPRGSGPVPYVLEVLTPYPDCQPTVMTFDVKDFGLK